MWWIWCCTIWRKNFCILQWQQPTNQFSPQLYHVYHQRLSWDSWQVPLDFKERTLISKCSVHFKLRMLHTWTHDFSLRILQFSSPNFLVAIPASSFLDKKLEQGLQQEKFWFKLIEGWTMEHNLFSALCFLLFPSVFLLLACQSPMCMQEGLVVSESIVSKHPYLYRQPMLHDVCTWSWETNCLHLGVISRQEIGFLWHVTSRLLGINHTTLIAFLTGKCLLPKFVKIECTTSKSNAVVNNMCQTPLEA